SCRNRRKEFLDTVSVNQIHPIGDVTENYKSACRTRIRYRQHRRKAIFRLLQRYNHRANYNRVLSHAYILMYPFFRKMDKKSSLRILERMCNAEHVSTCFKYPEATFFSSVRKV